MKRKILLNGIIFFMMILLLSCSSSGPRQDGSAEYPFLIYHQNDLDAIGDGYYNWGLDKHYRLENQIDLNENWEPIGSPDNPFQGFIHGNGNQISGNVTKPDQDYVGVFGYIGEEGRIYDVTLNISEVFGRNFTGTLAGYNDGEIINCHTYNEVEGGDYTGGLVGYNGQNGVIRNSKRKGEVKGKNFVGGIVGRNDGVIYSVFFNSTVKGEITGSLVGWNTGLIKRSLAGWERVESGQAIGSYNSGSDKIPGGVGGIAGYNNGVIEECVSRSTVMGNDNLGGLVGYGDKDSIIINSYANQVVQGGNENLGHFIGYSNGSTIRYSYSVGTVQKINDSTAGEFIGNIDDSNATTIENSFAIGSDKLYGVGTPTENGTVKNITSEEATNKSTYVNAGFDFYTVEEDDDEKIWSMDGGGYPVLQWQVENN